MTDEPLPTSRWRPGARSDPAAPPPRGAPHRVRLAQRQARRALATAAAFAVAALAAAVVPQDTGRWLPLHLFLTGSIVLAISGATVLFTVTWAAAPAPPAGSLAVQRLLVGAGAAGLAAARVADAPSAVFGAFGGVYLAGLLLLASLLGRTVRQGVERRFDVAVAWYLAGLLAGVVAGSLGALVGTGHGSAELRASHVVLNVLGLVGLVIGGTLPSFAATVARMRMSPRATARRHAALLAWQAAALVAAATGIVAGVDPLAGGGLVAYAAGIVAVAALLPTPGRPKRHWAGTRLLGLWGGVGWWAVAVGVAAGEAAGGHAPFAGRWLLVLVVAAYGQILWASLAYLVPVLSGGGHERLSAGFAATRSWPGLLAVNAAGLCFALGAASVGRLAVAWWVVDTAWRAVGLARLARQLPAASAGTGSPPGG